MKVFLTQELVQRLERTLPVHTGPSWLESVAVVTVIVVAHVVVAVLVIVVL